MVLKEWSEAQDVYKAIMARFRKASRAILDPRKVKSYWYVWAALFLCLLPICLALYVMIGRPHNAERWDSLILLMTALAILCHYASIEKALAKEFATDYNTHGILHYPFWTRGIYFVYTLFLQELKGRKYSHKQVEEL